MLAINRLLRLALSVACLSGAACGGEDTSPEDHSHLDGGHDHADGGLDEDEDAPCTETYPSFRQGLETKAGELTVRLLSVTPEPPRQKFDNTWVLEVVDAAGKPVAGASILNASTWMDVHNHGGRWEPTIAAGASAGQFQLTKVDFKMAGPWRLRFEVKANASAAATRAAFQICVE